MFFKILFGCLLSNLYLLALQAQELQLRYTEPAEKWEEALPIGNGRLGAMIYGGIQEDEIQFNEETLWTGEPRNYNKSDAHLFLDSIRNLLHAGEQGKAEALAMREFMGVKSQEDDATTWLNYLAAGRKEKINPSNFSFNDTDWKEISVPSYEGWEHIGLEGVDGAVWFRYEFQLSEEDIQQDTWSLDLNKVREMDFTYINGVFLGSNSTFDDRRIYTIPAGTLKKGKNVLAVQVINLNGKGGIAGYKDTAQHIGLVSKGKKISLNGKWKYAILDANTPRVGKYQAAYQPFGTVQVSFPHDRVQNYQRTLDLKNAEVHISYTHQGTQFERTYLASHPDQVLAMHYGASRPGQVSFEVELASKHAKQTIETLNEQTLHLQVDVKDGALHGDALLTVKLDAGHASIKNGRLIIRNANAATLYLTAATNFVNYSNVTGNSFELAKVRLKNVDTKNFQAVQQNHQIDYGRLFNTFSIDLGVQDSSATNIRLENFSKIVDPAFAALYVQYGRYLLISSSRENTQPANLQGIWNHLLEPSWDSKYTTNINLEMNYWPTDVLNLSSLHQPLFQLIRDVSEKGQETARSYYNARGWVLHHNTDLWRGTAPINNSDHGIWPMGGAWLVNHIWESYLFNQDPQILTENYDIIKGATLFFKDVLIPHPKTGELVSSPSNSPENGGLVAGPAMDQQIVRNLFRVYIQASKILDKDVKLRDSIAEMLPKIAKDRIGKHGQLQEWMEDIDDPENKHRHVSHLWALHPGSEVNWDSTPDLWNAARKSLIMRGDEGTGWSLAWKINFWARLLDAEHSLGLVKMLLRPADRSGGSYPNLFDAHPPFQIDGNFGGAAGIVEMIVQSHTQYIDILPALPNAFSKGVIKGIKARGGFVLDMEWNNHQLTKMTVRSIAGNELRLKYQKQIKKVNTVKNGLYQFDGMLNLIK